MSSAPQDQDNDRIPRFDQLIAMDPDEFVTAFKWAMNATSGEAHIEDPTKARLNLIEEDGSSTEVQFADTPITRIFMAMQERYGASDKAKYYSAALRIVALLEILGSKKLAPWVRAVPREPERQEIADSVVEAAAVVRLTRQLSFPIREFVRKVKEIDAASEP